MKKLFRTAVFTLARGIQFFIYLDFTGTNHANRAPRLHHLLMYLHHLLNLGENRTLRFKSSFFIVIIFNCLQALP